MSVVREIEFRRTTALDAAGRLRVSMPIVVSEHSFDFGVGSTFWHTKTNGAASAISHDGPNSSVILTCGTENGAYVYRQTYRYFHYRPGKSHLGECTGTFGAATANVRRRMGYFDIDDGGDGIFLEQNGTTDIAIVRRKGGVETRITQANWSVDPLDGTVSEHVLDLTTGIVFWTDLLWYGYGDVRVGFTIKGRHHVCHIFEGFGNLSSGPYMRTASLPVRYEIENLAVQGANHTLLQTCSQVVSEDGQEEVPFIPGTGNTGTTIHACTARRAIVSIRLKSTLGSKINRVEVIPADLELLVGTNDCYWEVVFNPTLNNTGPLVWVDPSGASLSAVEYTIHADSAAGVFTGGYTVASGHAKAGVGAAKEALSDVIRSKLLLYQDMDGANPAVVSLVVTPMTGTSNVAGGVGWREIQ